LNTIQPVTKIILRALKLKEEGITGIGYSEKVCAKKSTKQWQGYEERLPVFAHGMFLANASKWNAKLPLKIAN